jgi:hypothetical protein
VVPFPQECSRFSPLTAEYSCLLHKLIATKPDSGRTDWARKRVVLRLYGTKYWIENIAAKFSLLPKIQQNSLSYSNTLLI